MECCIFVSMILTHHQLSSSHPAKSSGCDDGSAQGSAGRETLAGIPPAEEQRCHDRHSGPSCCIHKPYAQSSFRLQDQSLHSFTGIFMQRVRFPFAEEPQSGLQLSPWLSSHGWFSSCICQWRISACPHTCFHPCYLPHCLTEKHSYRDSRECTHERHPFFQWHTNESTFLLQHWSLPALGTAVPWSR